MSLVVQSVNSTSLTLSWEPPSLAHQNRATLNYTLTCIPPAESGLPPLVSEFTTSGVHTLNGLTPATSYACSLFATNLYGNGPAANVSARTEDGGMFILLCDFVMFLSKFNIRPAYIVTFKFFYQMGYMILARILLGFLCISNISMAVLSNPITCMLQC